MRPVSVISLTLCLLMLLGACGKDDNADGNSVYIDSENVSTELGADESHNNGEDLSENSAESSESIAELSEVVIGTDSMIIEEPELDGYVYDNDGFTIVDGYFEVGLLRYKGSAEKLLVPSEINGKPVTDIYADCFLGCTKLKEVYIEDGVEKIGMSAFERAIKLTTIRLPDTLKHIDMDAFKECIALKEIYVPDSVERISNNAFEGCVRLSRVRLPASIRYIFPCFKGCTSLRGDAVIPDCGTNIYAIYKDCPNIKSLRILGGDVLEEDVFYGMTSLEEVHLPESVYELKDVEHLFDECPNLKTIYVVDGSYAAYALSSSKWNGYLASEAPNG